MIVGNIGYQHGNAARLAAARPARGAIDTIATARQMRGTSQPYARRSASNQDNPLFFIHIELNRITCASNQLASLFRRCGKRSTLYIREDKTWHANNGSTVPGLRLLWG